MSSFRQALVVTRPPVGAYNAATGEWEEGSPSTVNITGSVQPANDKQRKNVPEGYEVESAIAIATDTELLPAKAETTPGTARKSDTIALFGETYDIVAIERWQNGVISHYWATAARPSQS